MSNGQAFALYAWSPRGRANVSGDEKTSAASRHHVHLCLLLDQHIVDNVFDDSMPVVGRAVGPVHVIEIMPGMTASEVSACKTSRADHRRNLTNKTTRSYKFVFDLSVACLGLS